MSDQKNKEEGVEGVKVFSSKEENNTNGETLEEITSKEVEKKKIKNLMSVIIVLIGIALGAVMVDVIQFFSQSGYSEKALKKAEIFVLGDKTWVSYDDPIVEAKVLGVSEEELKNCPNCDSTEFLTQIKKFIPTLIAKKVDADSDEGKELIKKYGLKTIPSFVFDSKVKDSEFYTQPGVETIFEEKEKSYVLNASNLGIPIGKYLELPKIDKEKYSVLGNKDSNVMITIYSDYQCPYSKMFYDILKETVGTKYKDKVAMIYKDLPLDFHAQSNNAAMSALCAKEQGKFWEMADLLYKNQDTWGEEEGQEVFKGYAKNLGLDTTKFNDCLSSNKYQEQIDADKAEAKEFGISGTPSGFLNDQFIGGVVQKETLEGMIEKALNPEKATAEKEEVKEEPAEETEKE